MKLQNMYREDINRNINGVIKADQNDDANLEQEFKEYIITKELREHFNKFYDRYESSIDTPTDNVGVWISGFFGSGKSHFLKILSFLLENTNVAGKPAIDYFENKFEDPMVFAQVKRCASVPTESILFNIDVKSFATKDKTAILKVFAKVFYDHLGYFGSNIKVARFEQSLDRRGKLDDFKAKFEEINGFAWNESRDTFEMWQDDVVAAMVEVLSISEDAANNWFNQEDDSLSIELLVDDINKYLEAKGKDNRLIFCIDEIGQYMGSDTNLILNLQSIVEEVGTKCAGKVWVIVTSQEAIDSVTKVNAQAFSKIQGRFKTRLSLTSSSVDEVIKKRILAKTDNATELLKQKFNDNSSVLKNLISFVGSRADLKGYSNDIEFIETYPFIPYQFDLFQDTLIKIRQHGNAGQHQSSGERSMLSGFQEVAQKLNERDENAIVPFYMFYDTVNTFLESTIRQVIDRCDRAAQNNDGLEPYDVCVLKLLYLIRYIDDIPSNVENIATLMADSIQVDKIELKKQVQDSLNRLLSQNVIAKNGLTYQFLTDDEQDVAREIKNTMVDSAQIISQIASTIFDDLYMKKNFTYGSTTLGFDQMVDETYHGSSSNPIKIKVVTTASDLHGADASTHIMMSQNNHEAICVLSDEYSYYDTIESALKIRKYSKSRNISQLPETIQAIIRAKNSQATAYEKEARELIEKAIVNGTFYVAGQKVTLAGTNAKDKFDNALIELIEGVYTKLSYIHKNYANDAEVLKIFNTDQTTLATGAANEEAIDEMAMWLEMQYQKHLPTSMSDIQSRYKAIPYGWNEIDIAAVVCELILAKKINIMYGGAVVTSRDGRLIDLLRKKSEIDKTIVERRVEMDEKLKKNIKDFMHEYLDVMDIPNDEDELFAFVKEALEVKRKECYDTVSRYYTQGIAYPGRDVVMKAQAQIESVLKQQKDAIALFNEVLKNQDDLLDNNDDVAEVLSFFQTQRTAFINGLEEIKKVQDDEFYLKDETGIISDIQTLRDILEMDKPYRRINEIPNLIDSIEAAYSRILDEKKVELNDFMEDTAAEIVKAANGNDESPALKQANSQLTFIKTRLNNVVSISKFDAIKSQIEATKNTAVQGIFDEAAKKAADEARKAAEAQGKDIPDNEPVIKVAKVSRNSLVHTIQLKSAEEVEQYVEMIKKALLKELDNNDYIQII